MKARDPKQKLEDTLRRLIRARAELLAALQPDGEDVTLRVTDDGQRYTIRVMWRNCLLIANETQRQAIAYTEEPIHPEA